MTPYYEQDGITIYHGDCREVGSWSNEADAVTALVSDPPYGVGERTARRANGRGNLAACNDFPPVRGDDAPFDPSPWLTFPQVVLWGANHYADRLPASPTWLVRNATAK
jgi:site-specific DNA-methyltransferase (adenine-specific)/modification methylase